MLEALTLILLWILVISIFVLLPVLILSYAIPDLNKSLDEKE